MANHPIQIGDTVREMSDSEQKQFEADLADFAAQQQAEDDAAATRASGLAKLKALGLTDAEVAALVGG